MENQLNFYIEEDEAKQILICVIAISLAFTIVYAGLDSLFHYTKSFLLFTGLSVVTVGSGFILHEMAHKIVAIHYGAYARFRMWLQGLFIMFLTSFFGFLFAAPGAVYIYSTNITKKENGLISVVGPFVNILLASIFIILETLKPISYFFPFLNGSLHVWNFGAQINVILALFNMLPIFPLDGSKVFAWDKFTWAGFVIASLLFAHLLFPMSVIYMWLFLLVIAVLFSGVGF